jgi:hypothetical protein
VLVVVRGRFAADLVERIARTTSANVTTVADSSVVTTPDGAMMLAMKNQELLVGSPGWIRSRLEKTWSAAKAKPGSLRTSTTELFKDKPFFVLASRPSQEAVHRLLRELGTSENVAVDMIGGHELATVVLTQNSMGWRWTARDTGGYKRAVMVSEGAVDLFRASHFAARGMAKLVLASLRSYAGKSPEIKAVVSHEADLMKLVAQFTGDGKFQADIKKQPKQRTVTVKATGKKISDVAPLAGLVPVFGVVGLFIVRSKVSSSPPEAAVVEVPEVPTGEPQVVESPVPGLDVQSIYRTVKRAHGM